MNARNTNVSAQGKIDVNTGPSVNLTFGGSLNYQLEVTISTQVHYLTSRTLEHLRS